MKYKLVLMLLIIFGAGCSTSNVSKDYSLNKDANKGLLLVAISWSDDPRGAPGYAAATSDVSYQFKSKSGEYKQSVHLDPTLGLDFFKDFTPESGNGSGRIVALELPEGDYEFYGWKLLQGSADHFWNVEPFSIPFRITKGVASYIGELNLSIFRVKNALNVGVFGRGTLSLTDKSERDFQLIARKFPKIDINEIERKSIEFSPAVYSQ